jgi:hypothetical protein
MNSTKLRCVAPVGDGDDVLCGEPAADQRIVGDLVCALCPQHLHEMDEESDDGLVRCGNCYEAALIDGRERFFTCARCGEPTLECARCLRIAREEGYPVIMTCASCSLREEMHALAS